MKFFYLQVLLISLLLFSCNTSTQNNGEATVQTAIPNGTQKLKVISVKDGDTLEVLVDGKAERVRLFAIDCPESSQPFGKAAKKFTSDLCFGKLVSLVAQPKRDQYNRIIATVYIDDATCLNEELLKAGYAWHYKQYSNNENYTAMENTARAEHLGLWQDKYPIAPWKWRRDNSKK
jgi:endonuclease YncB( thermonuclease family)